MGKTRNDEVPMLHSQSPSSSKNAFISSPVNSMESKGTVIDGVDHTGSLNIDSKSPFTPACVPFQQFTNCNDSHCTFCKPLHNLRSAQRRNYVASSLFDHKVFFILITEWMILSRRVCLLYLNFIWKPWGYYVPL